jgi:CheY-like chemotaxis protein
MTDTGTRILIIDDDSFLQAMYKQFFERAGCTVATLPDADGNIANRVLESQPTLMMIDLIMPGRLGWNAIKILKTDERTKSIPIFAVSNQSDADAPRRAIENGAIDHLILAKFQPKELIDKILGYLENPEQYEQVAQRLADWKVEDVLRRFQLEMLKFK